MPICQLWMDSETEFSLLGGDGYNESSASVEVVVIVLGGGVVSFYWVVGKIILLMETMREG